MIISMSGHSKRGNIFNTRENSPGPGAYDNYSSLSGTKVF